MEECRKKVALFLVWWNVTLQISCHMRIFFWLHRLNYSAALKSDGGNRLQLAYILKLCRSLGFKWTITRNSIITSYISRTNLRRKVGIWFPLGWEVDQLWWTELPFKQWFPIDRPSGSESVRRMCSVRIMWHQSFCFNHNTCWGCNPHCSTAGIQTPAPQTKTTALNSNPPSPTSRPVHNKQDVH